MLEDAGAPQPLDFVSIDVEGHVLEVLEGFTLSRWQPRLLLIEDTVHDLSLHRYLTGQGYRWFRRTGINSWYAPAGSPERVGLLGKLQFLRKYYLGLPFRRAHHITGEIVKRAEARGCILADLPLAEFQAVEPAIDETVYQVLDVERSVASRASYGGTAPSRVREAIVAARRKYLG